MEIKEILLFASGGEDAAELCAMAARLARDHGAKVTGVCLCSEPAQPIADGYAIGPAGVCDVLRRRDRRIRDQAAPIQACYAKALIDPGLSAEWAVGEIDEDPRRSAFRARTFDLVILGRPDHRDQRGRQLAEALILAGGTPSLLIPKARATPPFNHVVVAWNGGAEAKRALDDALPFLKRASRVDVMIIEDQATSWLDQAAGDALLRRLARHGVQANLLRVIGSQHDTGDVLLERSEALAADLLVMGAYSHSRGAELLLGGATRTVLSHASIPVLMSR